DCLSEKRRTIHESKRINDETKPANGRCQMTNGKCSFFSIAHERTPPARYARPAAPASKTSKRRAAPTRLSANDGGRRAIPPAGELPCARLLSKAGCVSLCHPGPKVRP